MGCAFVKLAESYKASHEKGGSCASGGFLSEGGDVPADQTSVESSVVDISRFVVADTVIGVGGFGIVQVIELKHSYHNRRYALKSASKAAILKRPNGISCVMSELKALKKLKPNPFICNVQYAFQDDIYLYLVLELVVGGDMRTNLRNVPDYRFDENIVKFYACQLFLGIEACHQADILHRDVKPENILMTSSGYLKITDFGIAKILPDIENCRSTSGTHGYMAPEIYRGNHKHGPSADYFAIGVSLHEFLTGRRPFEAHRLQSFRDPSYQDWLVPDYILAQPSLSKECKDFMSRILCPQVSSRLGTWHRLRAVQAHPWLIDMDWVSIENQLICAPILPITAIENYSLPLDQIAVPVLDANKQEVVKAHKIAQPPVSPCPNELLSYAYDDSSDTAVPCLTARKPSIMGNQPCLLPVERSDMSSAARAQYPLNGFCCANLSGDFDEELVQSPRHNYRDQPQSRKRELQKVVDVDGLISRDQGLGRYQGALTKRMRNGNMSPLEREGEFMRERRDNGTVDAKRHTICESGSRCDYNISDETAHRLEMVISELQRKPNESKPFSEGCRVDTKCCINIPSVKIETTGPYCFANGEIDKERLSVSDLQNHLRSSTSIWLSKETCDINW